ncbi:hypothetical protein J2S74_002692 [Evansella vedderi]|uniref:Uncharacterized protein n=1 Tax=Evansella vedderi TaxID=38282 RepID=A0ABT9ZYX8_9BACI|nr:hypothetical protein [Evansella vedderi]MDQ0255310.1 hypothetical protein [Evansella vedderi]
MRIRLFNKKGKKENNREHKEEAVQQLMKGKKSGKVYLTKEGEKLLNKWK